MVHLFIQNGFRMALDSGSGTVLVLTELSYKILEYLKLPIAPRCPINLRYNLAKFPANDVEKAYGELYQLYLDGKLFADDPEIASVPLTFAEGHEGDMFIKHVKPRNPEVSGDNDANGTFTHENLAFSAEVLRLADEGSDRICFEPVGFDETDPCCIRKTDVPVLGREYDKLTAEMIRRYRDGHPFLFTGFEFGTGRDLSAEVCTTCWARHLCGRCCPDETACLLERKRTECALALKAATAE